MTDIRVRLRHALAFLQEVVLFSLFWLVTLIVAVGVGFAFALMITPESWWQ